MYSYQTDHYTKEMHLSNNVNTSMGSTALSEKDYNPISFNKWIQITELYS